MKEDTKQFKNIQPLSKPEHYRLWRVRVESALKQMKAWNVKTAAPMDTEQSNNYLLSVIADNFLEQMLDTDLQASTIWAYLQKTILVSSISSQATALSELMAFNYAESDMLANKTAILALQRNLKTAFNNSETVEIGQLVTLFALVNIPISYQPLRTTLEETKEELQIDELFKSLIREESSAVANGARVARVAVASPNQNFGPACEHGYAASKCWTCNPELRPVCAECKQGGEKFFRHSKERCPKRSKRYAKIAKEKAPTKATA